MTPQQTLNSLVRKISRIKNLPLYLKRSKTTGICGSPRRCVLAQWFADQSGGFAIIPGNGNVYLTPTAKSSSRQVVSELPQHVRMFIQEFDSKSYPYLIRKGR